LVEQIASGGSLSDEVVAQIANRTDGVPLFAEELTKSVLESGVSLAGIPATLHDSLMARLDRLASVRAVAQTGAAIGREFSYQLLRAVSRIPEAELQAALDRLVDSELVFQRGAPPDAVYSFKHALVQDAAHGLLRSARQQLHAQIAEALTTHSPELMDTQPELFAQHYAEAGLVEKSVAWWGKAGRKSTARSAMAEGAAQFRKGLDQLALLPDDRERQRQELEFLNALGAVLNVVKGFGTPEASDAYARALELWEQLGSPSEFLRIPYGRSLYHMNRGELDLALRLDEDLLRLSRRRNDPGGLLLAHESLGRNLLLGGRFGTSRSHLEEALALYDPISHRALVDPGASVQRHVNSQAHLGVVLFCLGYPDQALVRGSAAIAEARRLAHPPSLALSMSVDSRLLSLVRDNAALGERADQLFAVATEQGFPWWRAQGAIYRGWVKVKNGDVAEGISLVRSGSAAFRATGSEAWTPHYTALLARACEIAGQIDEAATLLDDALQIVERTGERWFEAELNRHKGQLQLRQGHREVSEELYYKALSIAQEQEAKLWELRAAVSLARLRHNQGRRAEARELLAPIYGWFTEGFDTRDLKLAKALLDELARAGG
jgi:predicted ATPase